MKCKSSIPRIKLSHHSVVPFNMFWYVSINEETWICCDFFFLGYALLYRFDPCAFVWSWYMICINSTFVSSLFMSLRCASCFNVCYQDADVTRNKYLKCCHKFYYKLQFVLTTNGGLFYTWKLHLLFYPFL